MVQTKANERLTAFVSTMVAVAILAAGVTAHQSAAPPVTDVSQVVSDLRFQLEMALRHDSREQKTRLAQLDAVMAAWGVAPQSNADRELLVAWLREAGTKSLPGVMQPLPAVPLFSTSDLVLAEGPSAIRRQVKKLPTPATDGPSTTRPEIQKQVATENSVAPPTLESLAIGKSARAPTPVTPTPTDPLEEQMIALRQPQSVTSAPLQPDPQPPALAPRPGIAEQPLIMEQNLLASVPVPHSATDAPVAVNLTELAARIAGYHDGLDEVELALLRMNRPDLEMIREQIEKLEGMTRDFGFVQLYYDSLTPRERQSILEPRSMRATLDEVRRQLERCEEVGDADFLGTLNGDSDQELADLRARIAEIERRTER